MTTDTALVVLAHGSRSAGANETVRLVGERVARAVGADTAAVAFLQQADPSLADAVDRAVRAGARRIVVVPLMLWPGGHVLDDVPREVRRLRDRHPGVTIRVAAPLGDHPGVVAAAADRAKEAME